MLKILLISIAVSIVAVYGQQQTAYGQCGGKNWTGKMNFYVNMSTKIESRKRPIKTLNQILL